MNEYNEVIILEPVADPDPVRQRFTESAAQGQALDNENAWNGAMERVAAVGLEVQRMLKDLSDVVQVLPQLTQSARQIASAFGQVLSGADTGVLAMVRVMQATSAALESVATNGLQFAGIDQKSATKEVDGRSPESLAEADELVRSGLGRRIEAVDRQVQAVDENTLALDRLSARIGEGLALPLTPFLQPQPETAGDLLYGQYVPELVGRLSWMIPTLTNMLSQAAEAATAAPAFPATVGPTGSTLATAETTFNTSGVVDVPAMNSAIADFEMALKRLEMVLEKANDIHVTVTPGDEWD